MLYAPDGSATPYAKDKSHVYFQGGPLGWIDFSGDVPVRIAIAGVDPSTFTVLFDDQGQPTSYSEDKNAVYYSSCGDQACATIPVDGAGPATFTVVTNTNSQSTFDAQDKNHEYLGGQIVQ